MRLANRRLQNQIAFAVGVRLANETTAFHRFQLESPPRLERNLWRRRLQELKLQAFANARPPGAQRNVNRGIDGHFRPIRPPTQVDALGHTFQNPRVTRKPAFTERRAIGARTTRESVASPFVGRGSKLRPFAGSKSSNASGIWTSTWPPRSRTGTLWPVLEAFVTPPVPEGSAAPGWQSAFECPAANRNRLSRMQNVSIAFVPA